MGFSLNSHYADTLVMDSLPQRTRTAARERERQNRRHRIQTDPEFAARVNANSREYARKRRLEVYPRFKLYAYKNSAKTKGHNWSLSDDQAFKFFSGLCYYCRIEAPKGRCNGIDRSDNTKGYIEGNCVTCCTQCNDTKSDYSPVEFDAWATRFADRWAEIQEEFRKKHDLTKQ